MSSQTFAGVRAGDTKTEKQEAIKAAHMSHLLNIQTATGMKSGLPMGARPIAPSPVHVSATQLIASQAFPNMQSNVQLLSNTLGGSGDQTQQQIKNQMQVRPGGSQSQQLIQTGGHHGTGPSHSLMHSNINPSQALIQTGAGLHAAVNQSLIQSGTGGLLQPQLGIGQNVMIPRGIGVGQTSMASLIRAGQVQVSQAATQPQTTMPTQTFQAASHLPRGQAQVTALNQHKPSPVASPMLRPNHTMMGTGHHQPGIGQTIMGSGGPRALIPVRTHMTSQLTRMTGATGTTVHTKAQNLPTAQHGDVQKVGGSSIQISVQQPRGAQDLHTRPTLSKLPAKPILHHSQQVSLPQMTQASPKVLMSSQGVLQSTPLTLTHKVNLGNLADPAVRLGILPPQMTLRPQKPVVHSTSQTAALAQAGMARAQKIIVPQSNSQSNLSSGTIITTVARTAGTGMNLGVRPQKVVVSHISMSNTLPTASHPHKSAPTITTHPHKPAPTITTHPHKSGPIVTTHLHKSGPAVSVQSHLQPSVTTATVTTIPIAKVTPQRQAGHMLHTAMLTATEAQQHRQVHTQSSNQAPSHPINHPASQSAPHTQPGMLLQPRNLNTTVAGTTIHNEATKTITQSTQDRSNVPQYNFPPEAYAYLSSSAMYSNLFNQQQMAAQTLAAVSNAQLAAVSQPHITATSNPHGVQPPTITRQPLVGPPGGLPRVNPAMMVSVDSQGRVTSHTMPDANKNDGKLQTTMASTHLQSAMGASHMTQPLANQNQPVPQNNNITASPRPSILRKRNSEGITMVKRQIFNNNSPNIPQTIHQQQREDSMDSPNVCAALSPKSSILDPSRENSQSSTDTASSAESTPKAKLGKLKTEAEELPVENGDVLPSMPNNNNESSPRKKPRKQLLHVNTDDIKADITDTDEEIEKFSRTVIMEREKELDQLRNQALQQSEYVDEDGVRWVKDKKRPPIALLSHYQCNWKVKNNHFMRYTDVKPKEERRPTVNELSNQKHVHQKCSGWKMYHLAAQVEDLIDMEGEVLKKMITVREQVAPKHTTKAAMDEDLLSMVHELSQGNIQRNRLFIDQMNEARTSMLKVLDHKKRILTIVNKHHSKRPVKKKERS